MNRLRATALLLCAPLLGPSLPARAQAPDFEGRPGFSEGVDLGYYLWKDGDTRRLRWTTKGLMRHFARAVTAEGGKLKSLHRRPMTTSMDSISRPTSR